MVQGTVLTLHACRAHLRRICAHIVRALLLRARAHRGFR